MSIVRIVSFASRIMFQFHDLSWWPGSIVVGALFLALAIFFCLVKKPPLYLVDYSCVKYGDEHKTNLELLQYFMQSLGTVDDRDTVFQLKVLLKSGIGEEAYVPRSILEKGRNLSMQDSQDQAQILILGAVDELLKKTGVAPVDVDVVIVNSGMFNPTPSLTALLVNRFKMRTDVKTYNLSGMGCSAGLIAVDLVKDLLRMRRNTYAVVVSTEVLQNFYDGKERSMMVTNCLFRSAASALLLSNRKSDKSRSKLELSHCLRFTTAADDEAYSCVMVREDEEGLWGAHLGIKLIDVATNALRVNIERLAPRVLPVDELLKVCFSIVKRKVLKMRVENYVPNFKLAFDHFCIHPGGRTVIEGIGKSLKLTPYDLEPSLMGLHRFGNTSCAGIWYILAYSEAKHRLKRGDKVWQIGLGSGFKCTTAVWRVLKDIQPMDGCNPWLDCIHRFPVEGIANQPNVRSFLESLRTKTNYKAML